MSPFVVGVVVVVFVAMDPTSLTHPLILVLRAIRLCNSGIASGGNPCASATAVAAAHALSPPVEPGGGSFTVTSAHAPPPTGTRTTVSPRLEEGVREEAFAEEDCLQGFA
jgi:hypothetical protein